MRFCTTLNNQKCMEWGLNATQGILLALLYEANSWAKEVIIEDKTYYFVSRNLIIKELPMFFEKADTVYRILKTLVDKEIIEYVKSKGMDLIRLTNKGREWNFIASYQEDNSEKNPNFDYNSENSPSNSEKNPSKFGKKSENNSEKNPTYKDTNIQKDINNKEIIKKESGEKSPQPTPKEAKPKKQDEKIEYIQKLKISDSYKQKLLEFLAYRKEIKKPIKSTRGIDLILNEFKNSSENMAITCIDITMQHEWLGVKAEYIKYANTGITVKEIPKENDTSHLLVDDDYLEQMKEAYNL